MLSKIGHTQKDKYFIFFFSYAESRFFFFERLENRGGTFGKRTGTSGKRMGTSGRRDEYNQSILYNKHKNKPICVYKTNMHKLNLG
jgi:hypothetical protein